MRTVDLVIAGDEGFVIPRAIDALQRGLCVLAVFQPERTTTPGIAARRLRRTVRRLGEASRSRLVVMSQAIVVCVDGIAHVEAVVIRYVNSGRMCAVNASVFLCGDAPPDEEPHSSPQLGLQAFRTRL